MTAIPTRQVDRVLAGEPALLRLRLVDADGEELLLSEDGLVSILDGAGEVIVDEADAPLEQDEPEGEEEPPEGSAVLTYALDPELVARLDRYTVVWTVTVEDEPRSYETHLEVCGGHLFSIADFRARGGRDADKMAAARIRTARRLAEDRFEEACRVAFVPRGARASARGDGSGTLLLPHVALRELYGLSIDGVLLGAEELAALETEEPGIVRRPGRARWPRGARIACHYAHGYDGPSSHVADAVLRLAGEYAMPDTSLPARATSISTDVGVFRVSVAGPERPTGIPDVDAVIAMVSRERPAVG